VISPQAEFTFRGIPDREDWWICLVSVGGLIIVDTAAGPLENVVSDATNKISRMSQRMRVALATKVEEPPDSVGSRGKLV
jgi:hypothetical protein